MTIKLSDVLAKFDSLVTAGESVLATAHEGQGSRMVYVDSPAMTMWSVNAATVVRSVFGTESEHYRRMQPYTKGSNQLSAAEAVFWTLKAARAAWVDGYVFEVGTLVRADVEVDLIDQATDLRAHDYNLPAVVLAGAVLEQHLRSVAPSWGVATLGGDGKMRTIDPLNVDLKKATAYDATMQKRITYLAGMRNEAAHGNSDFKGRGSDVDSMIREVLEVCSRVTAK